MKTPTRIMVVGVGGIGGTLLTHLFKAWDTEAVELIGLTRNAAIVDAIMTHGFQLRGVDGAEEVRGEVTCALPPDTEAFDYILLAVQPPNALEAAQNTKALLKDDGVMVCLQNGLCEDVIAEVVPRRQIAGAVVTWGASMVSPGIYERTSKGGFVLGAMHTDGPKADRLMPLARVLGTMGPISITPNLSGVRWSKLAISAAISSLGTIGGDRLGALMRHGVARRLALEIITETVTVAQARGIRLERISGIMDLAWLALEEGERGPTLWLKHAILLAMGLRYRRLRSSMLLAIERGRPPAVQYLNGEVVRHGERVGLNCHLNRLTCEWVQAVADGTILSSMESIHALAARWDALSET